MKARTLNCTKCRKAIQDELTKLYVDEQYKFYADVKDNYAQFATAAIIGEMYRRGRSKQYIKKLFDDIVRIFATSDVFGEPITMTDVITMLEQECDIDFNRIKVNIESKEEFTQNL